MQDEADNSESCVQPCSDLDLQQLLLTSLKTLQLVARTLVIIFEAEAMLVRSHRVVFEGCFQNTNEGHMVSCLSNEMDHRLWLQGPLNHLGGEWQATYIVTVLCYILECLNLLVVKVGAFLCVFSSHIVLCCYYWRKSNL